ncbi:stage III sporulation protein AA [Alkalihalophilus pseudofirmus]|nr:stage III sporulation protein AA [Alkalihalophilus pseudofirmus]
MKEVLDVLPEPIAQLITQCPDSLKKDIEEIRIRINRPLEVIAGGKPYYPEFHKQVYKVRPEEGQHLLNQLSQYSLYAFEEELKRGFITIRGGHRVGLAGKVIIESGHVKALRDISSYNIRIARQKIGVANKVVPHIYQKGWQNTLIVGAPQTGKTTLLRDIARIISSGVPELNIPPSKVGVVDERSEIAASVRGVPQHDLGHRIDVLDGCPKAEGMMMMIRSMSPEVLIVDEIGRKEDSIAIMEAIHAGVKIVTTVHGFDMEELDQRPTIAELMKANVFNRCIELTRRNSAGSIRRIRNQLRKDVVNVI